MGSKSYSKGISWFDDCRIPFVDEKDKGSVLDPITGIKGYKHTAGAMTGGIPRMDSGNPIGRYPANLLVCDDMLNDGKIYEFGKGLPHHKRNKTLGVYQGNAYGKYNNVNPQLNYENYYGDKGTNSRYYDIDKWFDNIISE
jgi:hypothetical protein